MKLLTEELEQIFMEHPFSSQGSKGMEAEVIVKYFNPYGAGTWLITEAEKEDGKWLLFGYCHVFEWEWGYVALEELREIKIPPFGLGIERDLHMSSNIVKDNVSLERSSYA